MAWTQRRLRNASRRSSSRSRLVKNSGKNSGKGDGPVSESIDHEIERLLELIEKLAVEMLRSQERAAILEDEARKRREAEAARHPSSAVCGHMSTLSGPDLA